MDLTSKSSQNPANKSAHGSVQGHTVHSHAVQNHAFPSKPTRFRLLCLMSCLLSVTACADKAEKELEQEELTWQQMSEQGAFEVTLDPQFDDSVAINEFLEWVLTVKSADGKTVDPARVSVSGGMPAHGHGLPSQPQVSEHPEDGKYLVKGLKFNMNGDWELAFDIQSEDQRDTVNFEVEIDF